MNLGEILDRTFQIYRSRFFVFIAIAAPPALAMMGANTAERIWLSDYQDHARILIFYMTFAGLIATAMLYHLAGFFQYLVRPVFIRTTAGIIEGEKSSIRSAISSLQERWRSLLVLNLAQLTIVLPLPTLLFIGFAVGIRKIVDLYRPGSTGFAFAALLVFTITGILAGYVLWMESCLALAFPASVLEGTSWFSALKRSWRLTKGSRVRLMLTLFLIILIGWGLNMLLASSTYFFLRIFPYGWGRWHHFFLYHLLYSLLDAITSTLISPVFPIAVTLFYYDQRIRREGYDVERMMESAGMNAPANLPKVGSRTTPAAEEEVQA